MRSLFLLFFLFFYANFLLLAQNDSSSVDRLLDLRVSDIYDQEEADAFNVQVSIASKKSENLFDAPFAVSVISKEEIQQSGATSIMEAFRLIPGLVVREQSNGNYDIHIRGGNNVQRNAIFSIGGNTTTLVMIDNRPIYNYYLGGTFWETLPIDLNDVERIELVRGASSAMYGPNAVSGVINIITRHPENKGMYITGNMQQGNNNAHLNNISLGYRADRQFDVILSGNWHTRGRNDSEYYFYPGDSRISNDSIQKIDRIAYPSPKDAVRRYGLNAFVNYEPIAKIPMKFSLSGGWQDSRVQKAYTENFLSPLTTALSNSTYLDLVGNIEKLSAQVSFQNGTQSEGLGGSGQKWDFTTYDILTEYDLNIGRLNIKPGFNYRKAIYDDTPYVDVQAKSGQFNARHDITNIAGYLRSEYSLLEERLRLIAALRLDWFNFPQEAYISYQFAASYKVKNNHLFRFSYSRANRSANIIFTYADTFIPNFPLFNQNGVAVEVKGNQDLELLTRQTLELAYRGRLSNNFQIEADFFLSKTNNYADFLYGNTRTENINGQDTPIQSFSPFNIPLETQQTGITLSLNYVLGPLQLKPFITYQRTTLSNSSTFNNTPNAQFVPANTDPQNNNIFSNLGVEDKHTGTPNFYGGGYLNYKISHRFNLNVSAYFYGKQEYYAFQNAFFPDGRGQGQIPSKFLLNTKFTYSPVSSLKLFVNARNLLNQDQVEFYNTDRVGLSLFWGIHIDY